jgi:DNA-binding MarR family transcriptional regulator
VAEALDVHLSTASRICDRLVQGGLLDRRDRPEDRRQVELSLTEDGQKLLSKVTDHRQAVFGRILRRMDSDGRRSLIDALTEFINAAEDYDAHRSLIP